MATEVKASCPMCGQDVWLKGPDITCYADRGGKTGRYEFTCPQCGACVSKDMGPEVCGLLKLAVGVTWVYPPAELDEHHDGPMLTHDDLITFAAALWTADDAEILARAVL